MRDICPDHGIPHPLEGSTEVISTVILCNADLPWFFTRVVKPDGSHKLLLQDSAQNVAFLGTVEQFVSTLDGIEQALAHYLASEVSRNVQ